MHHDYGTSPGAATAPTTNVGIVAGFFENRDRIHWGAVWGGLFAALATLFVLGVLGTAIGLTVWDGGDAGAVGWGMGIWMIISAIIAFFVGGWIAGRAAATAGGRNGLLNGAMVWSLALGLLLLVSGAALTNLVGVNVSPGAQAGGEFTGMQFQQGQQPMQLNGLNGAQTAGAPAGMPEQAWTGQQATQATGDDRARRDARNAAWWTLVALLVGLGCAAGGGWLGVQPRAGDPDGGMTGHNNRPGDTTTPTA